MGMITAPWCEGQGRVRGVRRGESSTVFSSMSKVNRSTTCSVHTLILQNTMSAFILPLPTAVPESRRVR